MKKNKKALRKTEGVKKILLFGFEDLRMILAAEAAARSFGAETAAVSTGDRVQIRRAKETTRLVKLSRESFMKIMREKMKGN